MSRSNTYRGDARWVVGDVRARLTRRLAFLASNPPDDSPEAEAVFAPTSAFEPARTTGPRIALARRFGLNKAEMAMLDLAVAVRFEPALEAMVVECQGKPWRPMPTEALARRLYDLPAGLICRPTSPLVRWSMVAPVPEPTGAAPGYMADLRLVDFYDAKAVLSDGLVGHVQTLSDAAPLPDWDLTAWVEAITQVTRRADAVRVVILGPAGSEREVAAERLVRALGRPAVMLDGGLIPEVQRFSLLTDVLPVWANAPETWLSPGGYAPLQIVVSDQALASVRGLTDLTFAAPALEPAQREAFWTALTGQPHLPLAHALASASELRNLALRLGADGEIPTDAAALARHDLGRVGTLRSARTSWDDMVLDPRLVTQLQGFATEVTLRATLLSTPLVHRLYARDSAPTALFSGPPGVGKTMAAECVAHTLGLPLLVIDVSRTVSKYIGETAKNLSEVFTRAERFGCIILFDEADAFFAKRTEGNDSLDRHNNADTNHLLQLIEAYEGPVILSTNKRANIDEAFFRRIRHSIDFRRPDAAQRRTLWQHFAKVLYGSDHLPGLELCAERFEFSPAQIKSAVLTVKFGTLSTGQAPAEAALLQAAARELKKEGRAMPADLAARIRNIGEVSHVA